MLRGKVLSCMLAGVLGVATIGGTASVAVAHGHPMDSPLGRLIAGVIGRCLVFHSEFTLTGEQREKIHEAIGKHKAEIGAGIVVVWQKRNALRDDVLTGKDEATIRKAADALGKAIGDAAVAGVKLRNDIDPVLTDEQRSMIAKLIQDNDAAVVRFFKEVSQHAAMAGHGHEKGEHAEKAERAERKERGEKAGRAEKAEKRAHREPKK